MSRIVRPERFILPEVSGISVPTVVDRDGELTGQWRLYLRWATGNRESRPLPRSLELENTGSPVFVHPYPARPVIGKPSGWSIAARRRWVEGEHAKLPGDVFASVRESITDYLDFPEDLAEGTTATLATWVLLTYCYPAWAAVPYLHFAGAKGSGKTTAFQVLERLVFRPTPASSLTAAVLFRTLHQYGGTLLLDEAERLRPTSHAGAGELNVMLLAGYKRGGRALRLDQAGRSRDPVAFDVFGPKAFAGISGLPPALASRCITNVMFRADPASPKPRRRIDEEPERWQQIRDDLYALALEHGPQWLELASRDDVCDTINGRDYELWQPLLALAAWLESHGAEGLLTLMQQHALHTIDAAADDGTFEPDAVLLRILADAVRVGERLTAADVLAEARQRESSTFRNWTAHGVSRRFRYYGIPRAVKVNGRRIYRDVSIVHLRHVQSRYGIDLGFEFPPTDAAAAGLSPSEGPTGATPGNDPNVPVGPNPRSR